MRHLSIIIAGAVAALIAGCENSPPPSSMYGPSSAQYQQAPQYTQYSTQAPPPDPSYDPSYDSSDDSAYPDQGYESVYIDPPLEQPPPVSIDWAPPPMLDEAMPPQPYPDAIWTGGYWVWQDNWVWARGRWSSPPQRGYRWVRPYYEHRGDRVIFINGFWCAPGVSFRRPPPNIVIPLARVRPGVHRGPRPIGPEGAFLPPPHGARRGSIVPASDPQPQAPRAQQDQRRDQRNGPGGDQNRDQNRDRGQDQVRTPPSMRPDDADRGQRDRDRNQPQQSRPPQPAVIPGAPQTQRSNNQDANQDAQRQQRQEQQRQQQQQQQQQQERTQQQQQQQQRAQQQQERTQQQQQRMQQQQERTQQQQQRAQQQQERAQQQQQRMQQQQERAQQQQQRVQQMPHPQPQIEQHAPPHVAPPRQNPPPAARPAPRPAAEPRDGQPSDDRGNRGRGHD